MSEKKKGHKTRTGDIQEAINEARRGWKMEKEKQIENEFRREGKGGRR